MEHHQHKDHKNEKDHTKHYLTLRIMAVLLFIAMYILIYAMVNKYKNVFTNVNQFYMAATMTMPMLIIEIILMRYMKMNFAIIVICTLALIGFYSGIRKQIGVSDRQFLKSKMPHHAGAILMCQESDLRDPELKKLCEEIVASQQKEIDQMKAKLDNLK